MVKQLEIKEFLEQAASIPIIDVRSPGEFEKGHIPGAFNIPLFTNEERALVGTCYKQKGKDPAVLLGLEIVGPKLAGFVKQAQTIASERKVLVHCWRGGMRSGSFAWLLNTAGFEVNTLLGGYKKFRNHVHSSFSEKLNILILGGMTGSGKTEVLKELRLLNEQVVDLEDLARHAGSSFGSLGKLIQPSQEHFENLLWMELSKVNPLKRCWLEDESMNIGKCILPKPLWDQMRSAQVVNMILPLEARIKILVENYANLDNQFLVQSITRIERKLGPQHAKAAIEALERKDYDEVVRITLVYYDKMYHNGLAKRDPQTVTDLQLNNEDAHINAVKLLQTAKMLKSEVQNSN